jgi:uncharacterized membrane protein
LWPEELGQELPLLPESASPRFRDEESVAVAAEASGYVDAIKDEALIKLAQENDLIIRLAYRPGHFAVERTVLGWVWPHQRFKAVTEVR